MASAGWVLCLLPLLCEARSVPAPNGDGTDRARHIDRLDRRPSARPALVDTADPRRVPGSGMSFHIEHDSVSFGDVVPGRPAALPSPLAVRVVSNRAWALLLESEHSLLETERGSEVPATRLLWRAATRAEFAPVRAGAPATLARGGATSAAGTLVLVDLRLLLEPGDPLGAYSGDLRLFLEPR